MHVGASLLAVVVVVLLSPAPCTAQGWENILPALTAQLTTLWQNNELEFMGNTCYYTQKPKFKSWEFYFQGTFSCPAWTRIKGTATTQSRSSVMTDTIENFLMKARNSGLVTPEEATLWLEGHQG